MELNIYFVFAKKGIKCYTWKWDCEFLETSSGFFFSTILNHEEILSKQYTSVQVYLTHTITHCRAPIQANTLPKIWMCIHWAVAVVVVVASIKAYGDYLWLETLSRCKPKKRANLKRFHCTIWARPSIINKRDNTVKRGQGRER